MGLTGSPGPSLLPRAANWGQGEALLCEVDLPAHRRAGHMAPGQVGRPASILPCAVACNSQHLVHPPVSPCARGADLICRPVGGCGRAGGPAAAVQPPSRSPCPASAP